MIAAPFVYGRLTRQATSVTAESVCHHCSEPFTLEIDRDMNISVETPGAAPVVFVPDVVPFDVEGPDIVDDF
ncbi:MAG: hypothetical protein QNJ12_12525 [Ilumatobacter sp.]|uniref:hypothetical protein n=1 Tax=Ilumatobacter sp. TaxID=1967498 RepID=UPI002618F89C|nr:hypothetical protein [Ilumatobacter sp.]MDJ0769618.1 hypothetical protein [Ilumatobacter sp.]